MGTTIAQTTPTVVIATTTIALIIMTFHGVSAQAPAPGPAGEDCFTSLLSMADCLTYVEERSNLTKPEKPCCPELAALVSTSPICLCSLLGNSSNSFGVKIDIDRALKLPSVCKVDTPPASLCSVLGIPVAAPSESNSAAPDQGPTASATPESSKDTNGASSSAHSVMAFLVGLAIAFRPTFF